MTRNSNSALFNHITSTALVAAISSDLRFTYKVSTYAERTFGKTLCLNGLRDVAREKLDNILQCKCVIPQANSRVYFGMSTKPTPREQKLNNFAIRSGFSLQVNELLRNGKEKAVDTKLVDDAYEYKAQGVSGFAIITGDKDFLNLCKNFTTNGIPFILFTARFENTYYSNALAKAATLKIDILSLINDPRVFKPIRSSWTSVTLKPYAPFRKQNHSQLFQRSQHTGQHRYNNTHQQHRYNYEKQLLNSVETAIQNVIKNKSCYLGRQMVFALQKDVERELCLMNVSLNVPLDRFLRRHSEKFRIGTHPTTQMPTVSAV